MTNQKIDEKPDNLGKIVAMYLYMYLYMYPMYLYI